MKIQCACGAKYAFDATPEMLQNPVRFVCPSCGLDSSEYVNELIRREFAGQTPAAPPPATESPRLKISHGEPPPSAPAEAAASAPAAEEHCPKHPRELAARSLRCLRKADVPAMHEIVRPCLFAAVPGEGRGAKYQHPGLCRAIVGGRGAVLAEGRRHWRFDCRRPCRGARFLDVVCVDRLGSARGIFHPLR